MSQYFPPEAGATQTRAFENVRYLARAGHDVTVVCEIPNHPAGVVFPGYERRLFKRQTIGVSRCGGEDRKAKKEDKGENKEGKREGADAKVCVIYVRVLTAQRKNFITRMGFYVSFMAGAVLAGCMAGGMKGARFDAVYVTSPPLPAAGAGLFLAGLWQVPLFFEVRDLWPDSAVALGELTNPLAVKLAQKLEQACYDKAINIIAVTRGICDTLVEKKQVPAHKVKLIPNGATTDAFFYDPAQGQNVRQELGLADRFVVLYAGILGIAQGLETLVAAAKDLISHVDIHFLVVGAGPKKAALEDLARKWQCTNITFAGERHRDQMPGMYAAADAALVPLVKNEIFTHARPSKMFDAWACETPVLLGIQGEARVLLDQCRGGLYYEPQDRADLVKAILAMKKIPWVQRRKMGKDARAFVKTHHCRKVYARQLEKHIRTAVRLP